MKNKKDERICPICSGKGTVDMSPLPIEHKSPKPNKKVRIEELKPRFATELPKVKHLALKKRDRCIQKMVKLIKENKKEISALITSLSKEE